MTWVLRDIPHAEHAIVDKREPLTRKYFVVRLGR